MSRYKLKYPFSERDSVPCAIGAEVFDLSGKGYDRIVPATLLSPEKVVKIRGATQKDLKRLYEAGGFDIFEKVEKAKPGEGAENVGND